MKNTFTVSLGIMAYNEENNIGKLLEKLLLQKTNIANIIEIVVVASGCTDRTEDIVKEWNKKDERIKLIHQEKREGKASAINLFLKNAKGEIIILESADTIPADNAVEELVLKFIDEKVGAVGSYVIPTKVKDNFLGFYTNTFWMLHHKISLKYPKCGEMVAFRNILPEIAYNTASDETWIIALLLQMKYEIAYAEGAIVYNKGPENIFDFLKQRRRHLCGYIHLKKELNFKPKTMDNFYVFKILLQNLRPSPKDILFTIFVILLEATCRLIALFDWYILGKNPYIWEVATSTKKLDVN